MTLDEIGNILVEIRTDVQVMKHKLGEDYKVLHGNGHPGLIDRMSALESETQIIKIKEIEISNLLQSLSEIKTDILLIKNKRTWFREWLGWIVAAIGLIVNIYMVFAK